MDGMIVDGLCETDIAREVDAMLWRWRARMLDLLHGLAALVLLVPVLAGRGMVLAWPLRAFSLLGYVALLTSTFRRDLRPQVRAGILLGLIAATGVARLSAGQLEGSGRLSLLVLPLLALLLVGPRAGWTAVVLSLALYAVTPALLRLGCFTFLGVPADVPIAPWGFWALQGTTLLLILLTLFLLFAHFLKLQRRTMIAERAARRQLEQEARQRRHLEEAIERAGEEERRRLGGELHDGLCQHLTASLLNCSAIEQRCRAGQGGAAEGLAGLRVALEAAIGMAYDVAKGLCPVDMAPDALVPALERLCRDVESRHGLVGSVVASPDFPPLPAQTSLILYQIAREAVANAVKHAHCRHVAITLDRDGVGLVLRIEDDGRGLPAGQVSTSGLGLRIMAHRAARLGGALEVAARPDGGLRIVCCIPGQEASP